MPPIQKVKDLKKPIEVGELIIHKDKTSGRKRFGEVVGLIEGRNRKFQVLEVTPHDFTPMFKDNLSELKFFSCNSSECKRLNLFRLRKKNSYYPGDVIRQSRGGRLRFGIIIGFTHPEGLYSDSLENGYNGKDLLECVEISGRAGLPHKLDSLGQVKRFQADPKHTKLCEVLPMDKNGGVRIKDYWEIKREASET